LEVKFYSESKPEPLKLAVGS
jgi:hypothetical protein